MGIHVSNASRIANIIDTQFRWKINASGKMRATIVIANFMGVGV